MESKRKGFNSLIASFVGNCGSLIFQPLELIKTRFQATDGAANNLVPNYKRLLNALKNIYTNEGLRTLYRGTTVYFIGLNIANMSFFYTYSNTLPLVMNGQELNSITLLLPPFVNH